MYANVSHFSRPSIYPDSPDPLFQNPVSAPAKCVLDIGFELYVSPLLAWLGPKIPLNDACDRARDVCANRNAICRNGRCECKDGYRQGDGVDSATCGKCRDPNAQLQVS